jgi:phage shock protein A
MEGDKRQNEKKRLEVATLMKMTEKQMLAQQARARDCEAKAMAALKQNNEELARFALTEKQKVDELAAELSTTLGSQRQMVDEMTQGLAQMDATIAQAKTRRTELLQRLAKAESVKKQQEAQQKPDRVASGSLGGDQSAFDGFERMVEKIENQEAQVEAHAELARDAAPHQDVRLLEAQVKNVGVDDALAALKSKMGR